MPKITIIVLTFMILVAFPFAAFAVTGNLGYVTPNTCSSGSCIKLIAPPAGK